jgi:hypothetical protein
MKDLEFKQLVLDTKSQSFCAAKWYNATIWLGSGMTTSCHHPLPHKIEVADVQANPRALHNTPRKKEERAQMQAGERPAGCEYCWKIEDIGRDNISDRVYKSKIYQLKDLDYAFTASPNEDINLKTLEISFDRTCQFACSYCNPAFSSSWVRDIHQNGPYVGLESDGRNHFTHTHNSSQLYNINETNPYIEAFFQWWESDLHATLDELRITGGEPLVSGYTWKLINWFIENKGKSKTRLAINSNLGVGMEVINQLIDKLEGVEFDIYTSMEATYEQAEYIRDGLDFPTWVGNISRLHAATSSLRQSHVMCTVNALCLDALPVFIDLILQYRNVNSRSMLSFTLNILRFPSFQSPLVLPNEFRLKYSDKLEKRLKLWTNNVFLHEHERNHITRLIDYLREVDSPHSQAADRSVLERDFKRFYTQYDQRRNKNFVTTFPNLKEWYESISI